ncbi:MAG: hypothetical protein M3Q55_02780 [Acidobacteriota bacterium]|nr:hypothetical protein [Acidobacteriota bacterium]
MHPSLIGALLMAAVTTAGDYAWFAFGIRHTPVAGVIHGVILLATLGAFLGAQSRKMAIGAAGGLVAGALGALSFYAMWSVIGWTAMFVSWALVWIGLAAFDGLVLRRASAGNARTEEPASTHWLLRGLIAAVAGAAAFYAVSGVWTAHAENPNYGWHFVAWLIAWWPGLAALTFGRGERR